MTSTSSRQQRVEGLILGDCLEVLGGQEVGTVDLVLTDPPWMVSQEVLIHRGRGHKYQGTDISLNFGPWDQFKDEGEYWAFTLAWLTQVTRVCRRGAHLVCFFDVMKIGRLAELGRALGWLPRQVLVWRKSNPVPRARCVDFMVATEHALWMTLGSKARDVATFNYKLGQMPNCILAPIPGHTTALDGERSHPTQKPVQVLMTWVRYLSNPGDLVLDPFAGSGASLVAAKATGRRFLGVEKDRGYWEKAVARLARVESAEQGSLDTPAVRIPLEKILRRGLPLEGGKGEGQGDSRERGSLGGGDLPGAPGHPGLRAAALSPEGHFHLG